MISVRVCCTELPGLPRVLQQRHSQYPVTGTKFVDLTELSDKGTKVLQKTQKYRELHRFLHNKFNIKLEINRKRVEKNSQNL